MLLNIFIVYFYILSFYKYYSAKTFYLKFKIMNFSELVSGDWRFCG